MSDLDKDFFQKLGKVSRVEVPSDLDKLVLSHGPQKSISWWKFAIAPAMAMMLIVFLNQRVDDSWMEYAYLLDDYEVLALMEEVDSTELPVDLTDEEWAILLEDKDV